MLRPIYLERPFDGSGEVRIYLLGNPVVWWASTFCIIYVIMSSIGSSAKRSSFSPALHSIYCRLSVLPERCFVSLFYESHHSDLGALMYLDRPTKTAPRLWAVLCLSLVVFLIFAPINYATYVTEDGIQARAWICSRDSSRKNCQK